jgi:hypothetical protein
VGWISRLAKAQRSAHEGNRDVAPRIASDLEQERRKKL